MATSQLASAPDPGRESPADALARLYDLDVAEDPGDVDLHLALAARTGDPIVELAVGSGRIAVPLAAAGHAVTGIDRDPAMLGRARRRWEAASSRTGSLELVEADVLAPRTADGDGYRMALLGLNSLLLFADAASQRRVIDVMAGLVSPGGLVVVDAWQPQPVDLVAMDGRVSLEWLREDPETGREVTKQASAWYDHATRVVSLTTIFEESAPGGPVLRWTRVDRLRLASAEELQRWAEGAGLDVEQLGGDYGMAPYAAASDRAILVARRRG